MHLHKKSYDLFFPLMSLLLLAIVVKDLVLVSFSGILAPMPVVSAPKVCRSISLFMEW